MIYDRLVFGATNYKPLLLLRDSWVAEASSWYQQFHCLKRAFEKEENATRAAVKRAADVDVAAPAVKRLRVRSAQVHKPKHFGSLTVEVGDICFFVETLLHPVGS